MVSRVRSLTAWLILMFLAPVMVFAEVRTIVFPVQGEYSFRNDFAEPRDGGAREHLGIDIIADKMTPLVAAVDGTVTFIAIPQASWGYAITIRDSDGYQYRYLHMNNDTPGTDDGRGGEANAYAAGLRRGSTVTRGQVIGWVGDSGNAESTVSHLHFEIRAPSRSAINPYDTLIAASGGNNTGQFTVVPTHTGEVGLEEEERFIATRQLQEGLVDTQVATLHQQLQSLGYYSGSITDTYDSVTREAVRRFQVDEGLTPTGIADGVTQRRLKEKVGAMPLPVSAPSLDLEEGASGESVRALQLKLAELGFFTTDATGYFGPITRNALADFQKANGISPAAGYYGPITRSALAGSNVVSASESSLSVAEPETTSATTLFAFSRDLELGSRGEDVRELQKFLNAHGFQVAATGAGSPGNETTYFGSLTQKALASYQAAHNISPAAGYFGPITLGYVRAVPENGCETSLC